MHRGAPIQTAVPLESVVLGKVDLRRADLDVLIRKVFGHRVVAQMALAVEASVAEALVAEALVAAGASVEAELGLLAGEEDGLSVAEKDAKMTDPAVVRPFLARTEVDALARSTASGKRERRPSAKRGDGTPKTKRRRE